MARIIAEQKNRWGAARSQGGGLDPQRNDLWVVDFTEVVRKLNDGLFNDFGEQVNPVPAYFAQAVVLPELRVKPESIRRNSRPYNMPSWDDALDACKITFLMDSRTDARASHIYNMLDTWRLYVRAGRGGMGTERAVTLDRYYRIDYRFPLYLTLLRGSTVPLNGVTASSPSPAPPRVSTLFTTGQPAGNPTAQQAAEPSLFLRRVNSRLARDRASIPSYSTGQIGTTPFLMNNDLGISGRYVLEKCWLGGFRLDTLTYAQPGLASIEVTIYAENVLDELAL